MIRLLAVAAVLAFAVPAFAQPSGHRLTFTFETGTETGAVMVALYADEAAHDVNANGKMDVNPFGMPTEPFAFSNNAVGNMGPAKWERARFDVSGVTAQTIRIR
jgi:uncharacterized protein (DUF2141 family)